MNSSRELFEQSLGSRGTWLLWENNDLERPGCGLIIICAKSFMEHEASFRTY